MPLNWLFRRRAHQSQSSSIAYLTRHVVVGCGIVVGKVRVLLQRGRHVVCRCWPLALEVSRVRSVAGCGSEARPIIRRWTIVVHGSRMVGGHGRARRSNEKQVATLHMHCLLHNVSSFLEFVTEGCGFVTESAKLFRLPAVQVGAQFSKPHPFITKLVHFQSTTLSLSD